MNFADLNAAVTDFRHACSTQIDPLSLSEVGVRGPAGASDEAAFLRLTAWSYALLFECGRILIPFLLQVQLPGAANGNRRSHDETLRIVHALRTWLFHSLTPHKEHDITVSKIVSDWFLRVCNSTSPQTSRQWSSSFESLCMQVFELVRNCTVAVSEIATAGADSKWILDNLRLRLGRDWPAHQFDAIVDDAASRLGETINARALRERRIADWRKFLSTLPEDADLQREMERLIDAEVANHFNALLPLTTRELMEVLNLDPGPRVKTAIEALRRAHESGIRDRNELIATIARELQVDIPQGN